MTATAWPTDDAAYGIGAPAEQTWDFSGGTDLVKAQVSEMCAGIDIATSRREQVKRVSIYGTFRRDLLKYAAEVQGKPSPSRQRRHRLGDQRERRAKLIDETGYDLTGILCEPPEEQWVRPQAMPLYHRLMVRDPGLPSVNDYEGEDLRHLAWMTEAELLDITEDGHIWCLSDVDPPGNNYPGAPVTGKIMIGGKPRDKAGIGHTHHGEEVEELVLEVWQMIVDGNPVADIPAEYRKEMTTAAGIRISGRTITAHCNRLLAARLDRECNCLNDGHARGLVGDGAAWDIADHGQGCRGRYRWLHVEVVRRAIRNLMDDGMLVRTDSAHLTRRGHTEHRIPAAYEIPADAGWRDYAARAPRTRHRRWSSLRKRLLGDTAAPAPSTPLLDPAWEAAS